MLEILKFDDLLGRPRDRIPAVRGYDEIQPYIRH